MRRYEPPDGWVMQAYRFALEPTEAQMENLLRHCGAARFVFNHMLARVGAVRAQREAEASYGVGEDALTPWQGRSLPALRRTWNQVKPMVAPWWGEVSKEAFNTGLDALSRALGNWQASRAGARKGRRVGFPRFKSRNRSRMSVRFTTGAIRIEANRRHVVLPRLGRIRTGESTRKLTRRVEGGSARILSATVAHTGGRWFCSFQVEVRRAVGRPAHAPRAGTTVGVDAGVKHLAVLSTGERVPNPTPLRAALKKLGKAQRTAARRRLARAVSDASPATLRRHLAYKTVWYGSVLHVADRWYPSSKTCSACLAVKPKLSLSERIFTCGTCGMVLDRDLNAARNLAALVRHVDLELPGDAKTGRGAYGRPAPSGGAAGHETSRPPHVVNVARQRTTTDHELTHAS